MLKKITIIFFMIFVITVGITAAELTATIKEVSGKVEAKIGGGGWRPVVPGDKLTAGDSISTGFNSKAVMILGDSSVVVAKDLTRLTLSELVEKEGTVVTDLFLDIGNVRSEVHSSEGVDHDFTIRNANSTASVRGTVLDVEILGDGQGMKVMAWDGMAVVTDIRTGKKATVGEEKKTKTKEKKDGEESDSSDEADGEEVAGDDSTEDAGADLPEPSEPPAEIASAPLLASGADGGMVTPMATAIAQSIVTVSTKPPSPSDISTGGGSVSSTETESAITAVITEVITTVVPTTTNVNIQVNWPE